MLEKKNEKFNQSIPKEQKQFQKNQEMEETIFMSQNVLTFLKMKNKPRSSFEDGIEVSFILNKNKQ